MKFLTVIILSAFAFVSSVTSLTIARSVPDLCSTNSPCGKDALCSVNSNLMVCRCPDGYSGDGFTECIAPSTTTAAVHTDSTSISSVLLPSTETEHPSTTIGSTSPIHEIVTSSDSATFQPSPSQRYEMTSQSHGHSQSQTHYYEPVTTIIADPNPSQAYQPQQVQPQKSHTINNEDVLTQFPSAPPTLSHFAHLNIFQQRIQAQPIQFGDNIHSGPSSFPAMIHQQSSSVNYNNDGTRFSVSTIGTPIHQHEIFSDGISRPQLQQMFIGHKQGEVQGHEQTSSASSTATMMINKPSGHNQHYHHHNFHSQHYQQHPQTQSHYHEHSSTAAIQNHNNNPAHETPSTVDEDDDYHRVPILGTGNNVYPVGSSIDVTTPASVVNHQHHHPIIGSLDHDHDHGGHEHVDDEVDQRDQIFIKDPLGKYEKCHTVNNILVCAENINSNINDLEKLDVKLAENQSKPSETRRIDSKPVHTNNNDYNSPINTRYPEEYYPSSQSPKSRYPMVDSTTSRNQAQQVHSHSPSNIFSQMQQNYPSTSTGTGMGSNMRNDDAQSRDMCQRFCGEGSVCRIILERPVCGCPEGYTGDPASRCFKYARGRDYDDTKNCQRHADCASTDVCTESKCIDPCLNSNRNDTSNLRNGMALLTNCGPNAGCVVIDHTQLCKCNDGFTGNAYHGCSESVAIE